MTVAQAESHTHTVNAVIEDAGPCKKIMRVEVPKDEVAREIDEQIEQVRRNIKVKGFRQGKVPRKFVEKNYRAAIEDDVRKHLLEHSYVDALKDKGVDMGSVLGQGRVEDLKFSAEEGLTYKVVLQVRPSFQLPDYKAVKVEVTKLKVTDDDVEKELDGFRRTRGEIRPVEDAGAVVEAEDILTCDVEVWLADEYEQFVEEQAEKKKDKKDEDQSPLKPLKTHSDVEVRLVDNMVLNLEVEDLGDALTGLKIGEWGEAETQLPVDYEISEGKNEAAVLRLKVGAIKRLFTPQLTDDWAKSAGYDTVDHMKREARENLFRSRELAREDEVEQKVVDTLLHTAGEFPLPQDLIESEIADWEKRREVELRMQENKEEAEAKRLVESEKEEARTNVVKSLRTFFVIDEIAKRESIRVGETDVDARVARIAAASRKPPAEVKKFLDERGVLPQLRHEILNEKTRAWLREHAQIVESED